MAEHISSIDSPRAPPTLRMSGSRKIGRNKIVPAASRTIGSNKIVPCAGVQQEDSHQLYELSTPRGVTRLTTRQFREQTELVQSLLCRMGGLETGNADPVRFYVAKFGIVHPPSSDNDKQFGEDVWSGMINLLRTYKHKQKLRFGGMMVGLFLCPGLRHRKGALEERQQGDQVFLPAIFLLAGADQRRIRMASLPMMLMQAQPWWVDISRMFHTRILYKVARELSEDNSQRCDEECS